jgi:hypothetical protein
MFALAVPYDVDMFHIVSSENVAQAGRGCAATVKNEMRNRATSAALVSTQNLNRVFPAAMPPDVRKWLCPSGAAGFLMGLRPSGLPVQEIIEVDPLRLVIHSRSVGA